MTFPLKLFPIPHERRQMLRPETIIHVKEPHLCETEVLAASRHSRVQTLTKILVTLVLRKIKLCKKVSVCMANVSVDGRTYG